MHKLLFIALLPILYSCGKDVEDNMPFSEANYVMTISGQWSTPAFTTPANGKFTSVIGMVHNQQGWLWRENQPADLATEAMAENGNIIPYLAVIDSIIAAGSASAQLFMLAPPNTGSGQRAIYCNTNFSQVSFMSMLGPTPDWFIGLNGFNLFSNDQWVSDTTINLYVYDGGTEDGTGLSYNNPPSIPQQNIHVLSVAEGAGLANGNPSLGVVATVRFVRQ